MSGTFERLRLPAALALMIVAGFVLWPRGGDDPASAGQSPVPSVRVGVPGGEVVVSPSATPAPTPMPTEATVATPTPAPTPPPPPADEFAAEIVVCRSISGATCNDQISSLSSGVRSFTALVRFSNAIGGDTLNAVLSGPSGTLPGGPYTLGGGGDGYYYSTFVVGNLPAGDYVVTATRNGVEVAATGLRKSEG